MGRYLFERRSNMADMVGVGIATSLAFNGQWLLAVLVVCCGAVIGVLGERRFKHRWEA